MKRFWGIFFAGLMILGAFPLGAKAAPAEVAAKSAVLMEVSTGKLLYEQNANAALKIADSAFVLETGSLSMQGTGKDLLNDPRVKEAYLGKHG